MSEVLASYSTAILTASGKVGNLKPDANGYRPVTLGAFSAETETGVEYPFNAYLKAMFESSSALMDRCRRGKLRGEDDHPEFKAGMKLFQYLDRLRKIHGPNVCCHFTGLKLVEGKDDKGNKVIRVEAGVKESGAKGEFFAKQMANPEEDVSFSVRSIINFHYRNGKRIHNITELLTWDTVPEGGFNIASKYQSPGLESLHGGGMSFDINAGMLDMIDAEEAKNPFGNESGSMMSTTMLKTSIGWQKTQIINPFSEGWQ